MFLVARPPYHNFVTNTPIKFIFIAIEIPDYKNPMIFGINRKNKVRIDLKWREMRSKVVFGSSKMAAGRQFVKN